MAVDNDTVKKIAMLAKLSVKDDEAEQVKNEFNKILAWVEQLKEVDTQNVEPMIAVNNDGLVCREDEVNEGCAKDEVLQNAPSQEYGYFAVPKFVE